MADAQPKDEFRNTTNGFIGVITIDPTGKEKGVAVRPKSNIWLSEAEQILTANAPRLDKDNPFVNGSLELVTKAADVKNRRPIGDAAPQAAKETPEEPQEEVAPASDPPPPAPEAGAQGNTAPKPETAEERAEADRKRTEAEKAKAAEAQKQAAAGAKPVGGPPAEPSRSGTPRPTRQPEAAKA